MNKIELSESEIKIIRKHLNGQYDPFTASEKDQLTFNDVIEKAEKLEEELDAIDERMEMEDCDIIRWFMMKYMEQENSEK